MVERIYVRQAPKHGDWIEGYTPRLDRAKRVRMLISTAFESYYDWPEPEDGPGAAVTGLRRGKGGIRTLEGALHPLPA